MNGIKISAELRKDLAIQVKSYLSEELDVEIGNMDSEFLIDFLMKTMGPRCYNAGVRDAANAVSERFEQISDDLMVLELPDEPRR